jgi:hypothetical protein
MEPRRARALSYSRCVRHRPRCVRRYRALEAEQAAALAGHAGALPCQAEWGAPLRGFFVHSYPRHRRRVPALAAALRSFSVRAVPGARPPAATDCSDGGQRVAEHSAASPLAAWVLPVASERRASWEPGRRVARICAGPVPLAALARHAVPAPHVVQAQRAPRRAGLPASVLQWPWLQRSRRRGRDAQRCAVSTAT